MTAPAKHKTKAAFAWDDPLLLDDQLTEDERMVRDAARAYCQDKLGSRVLEAFRHETMDTSIFRELLRFLSAGVPLDAALDRSQASPAARVFVRRADAERMAANVTQLHRVAVAEGTSLDAAFRLLEMPTLLDLPQGTIQSTLLPHGGINTLGLLFTERSSGRRFAYYTDCKRVPHEAVELARGADALVLDGLRPTPHPSHLSIPEAVEVARSIGAKATWLTHLTHHTDHGSAEAELPTGIRFAHDGMRLSL